MANPEHLAKLKEGVTSWNEWRENDRDVIPDLSEANLRGANLNEADLRDANLREVDLSEVGLSMADLSRANLWRADLSMAYLSQANLRGANFSGANLSEADLRDAKLSQAKLCGAYLRQANLWIADLRGADLSGADLSGAYLRRADLSGADLTKADLTGATLVMANCAGATLSGCRVYGISAWDVKLLGAIQSNLVITHGDQPDIQVDNLEVAQFIYLLLNNTKIREVIDTIGKKAVLILGRFTPERNAVLDAIRDALRQHGYLPILFNFEEPSTRDLQETIVTLAGLSRFILADISDPKSIPQELVVIVQQFPSVPVQPLLQSGYEPWAMYDHIKHYGWVLPLHIYSNQPKLLEDLKEHVIVPAESKARALGPHQ